jgi:hypothetical protein
MSISLIANISQTFAANSGITSTGGPHGNGTLDLVVGDIVFAVHAGSAGTRSTTDAAGNSYTLEASSTNSNNFGLVYAPVTVGGNSTFSYSDAGSQNQFDIFQFRSTTGFSALDGTPIGGAQAGSHLNAYGPDVLSSTYWASPASITTTATDLCFAYCGNPGGAGACVMSAGTTLAWTSAGALATVATLAEYATLASGTITPTFGLANSGQFSNWDMVAIAVTPSAGTTSSTIAWLRA